MIGKEDCKSCFTCKQKLPLKEFHKVPEKDYQLPSDKGTTVECRTCSFKRIMRKGEKLHPYRKHTKFRGELRRFIGIPMNAQEAYDYCFTFSDEQRKEYTRNKLEEQGLEPYNE